MEPDSGPTALPRRQFLLRLTKAAGVVLAAAGATWLLHDPDGPERAETEQADIRLPNFAVAGLPPRMAVARGAERVLSLRTALAAIGGIEAYVKPGDRVLLKVNAAFASAPVLSATTHPELVAELTRMCLAAGAAAVVVTDNPINDPRSCFVLTGIADAARTAGARVVLPQPHHFESYTLPGGRLIRNWPLLYAPLKDVNKVIGVAPVKDHHRSGASMTMKNWYGLLGGRRNVFHQDIHTIITELAMMIRPTLVVLDGTAVMMRNGPTGGSLSDLKAAHTMIVGTDQVAVDAFGANLLEKSAGELAFIAKAAEKGAGTADWQSLNPVMATAG